MIVYFPLVAEFTCCQVSEVGSAKEAEWVAFDTSLSVKDVPSVT